jgi:NADPH-dependent 2,4-dienoyl-CoA reductase/sulfur reductase-like enzyme
MSAAARARRLDETAEIIVLERGDYVSFANCGLPYFVGGEITDEIRTAAAGRPLAVMCAAGVRSYLAHRILDQEGFDSSMLSGGMRTLKATLGSRASAVLT